MSNQPQSMTTEFRQPASVQRPTLHANRRYDASKGAESQKQFHQKPFQKGQAPGKKPGQRNLEPNERMLAVGKREGRQIKIALASVDEAIVGKVADFGKYEIIVEMPNGDLRCVFKSDISTFVIQKQVN